MEVEVIKGQELSDDMKSLWHHFQASRTELSSPFFCHEFISIVSSCRDDIYVAVITENNSIIGFFPFTKGKYGLALPVGGAISDYHGYVSDRDLDFESENILKKSGILRWSFDHLISKQATFFSEDTTLDVSPIIELSLDYEHYRDKMQKSGSKIINKVNRWRRKLEEEYGTVRIELSSKNLSELNICIEGKKKQFLESGLVDPFSEPWLMNTIKKIQAYESKEFSGVLSVLYAGDKVIATHMGMRSENVWHYWFPSYDHDFSKFSPGLILLAAIIEGACAQGMSYIDLGKGNSFYKDRVKNNEIIIAQGVSVAKGMNINVLFNLASQYVSWAEDKPKLFHFPVRLGRRLQRNNKFK